MSSELAAAHQLRLDGKAEEAARAVLSSALPPSAPGKALLLGMLLVDNNRLLMMGAIAERLTEAFIRRGNLAMAVMSARWAERAQEDGLGLITHISEAFGKGSPRLLREPGTSERPPPPLPKTATAARPVRLGGEALWDRCEEETRRFAASEDPVTETQPLPALPLFGELEPTPLAELLAVFELREHPAGALIVSEGEEGHEAYLLARGRALVCRQAKPPVELALLDPGAVFGEMSLVSEAPRAATVMAEEPVHVLAASRGELERLSESQPVVAQRLSAFCYGRMVANLVRHSPVLSAVEPEQRSEIIERFRTRTFEPGQRLVTRGQRPTALFLIAGGDVEVRGRDSSGSELVLATLGPGHVVGEMSLVLRRTVGADVVARHPTVALELTEEAFRIAIEDHPGLLQRLYALASERDEETETVLGQKALDAEDVVLL